MRGWVWAGVLGLAVLACTLELKLSTDHPPSEPPAWALAYPPRTLPEHTRLVLLNPQRTAVWHSGEALDPGTLEAASYVAFVLPTGLTYTYAIAGSADSLEDLEVQVGDQQPRLGALVKNRGYSLSGSGELEREK